MSHFYLVIAMVAMFLTCATLLESIFTDREWSLMDTIYCSASFTYLFWYLT